jgi:UDP-N-acetylmuramoyl-tripeptide--D-alanyl-D-alanine ligase
MKFNDKTDYGVFETAITHPGHLIHNCEVFKPQIGIITNIGIDHLNWCKTLDNYIRTKAELLVGLNNKGHLIINNDDNNIKKIDFSDYKGKVITFGTKNKSNYFGKNIKQKNNNVFFTLVKNNREYNVIVPGNGSHNAYNALAALACLNTLGMPLEEAIYYLSKYNPIRSHTEIKQGINNSIIIDDTWSSNPTSVKAALEVLTNIGENKTKIVVMGKISYLGKYKKEFYKQIAKDIVSNEVNVLITIDEDAKKIGNYSSNLGMMPTNIFATNTKEELTSLLKKLLNQNSVALFKTSMLDKNSQENLAEVII